jgi:5-methylcytosine-specific restriction endonuclease McrA
MLRFRNSNVSGGSFGPSTLLAVWSKGRTIPGYSAQEWRQDACGASIQWAKYGEVSSQYGWEVDHVWPVAAGGTDSIENLQPLQWSLNRDKADNLFWNCPVLQS